MFNVHNNKTSNGITITKGLKVRDYDYKEGIVLSDDYEPRAEYMCCDNQSHVRDNDLKFDNTHESCNVLEGCKAACNHDHWFTVETKDGTKSFNGSRLKAI